MGKQLATAALSQTSRSQTHIALGARPAARPHPDVRRIMTRTGIQPKLTVGPAQDAFETEADRVADQVMRMPEPACANGAADAAGDDGGNNGSTVRLSKLHVQRTCAHCGGDHEDPEISSLSGPRPAQRLCAQCEEEAQRKPDIQRLSAPSPSSAGMNSGTESVIRSMQGGGAALPATERAFFEPRFGRSFDHIRIHDGARADTTSRAISARAFTLGNDIAFAKGEYRPGTSQGRHLLAHELTHTVQQGADDKVRREPPESARDLPPTNFFPWPSMTPEVSSNYFDENVTHFALNLFSGLAFLNLAGLDTQITIPLRRVKATSPEVVPMLPPAASQTEAEANAAALQEGFGDAYRVIGIYRGEHGFFWPTEINPLTAPRTMSVFDLALAKAKADVEATRDTFVDLALWYLGARLPVKTSSPKTGGSPKGSHPPKGSTPPKPTSTPAPKAPAAAAAGTLSRAAEATLTKLKGPDLVIMRDAMMRATSNGGKFMDDVGSLAEAVAAWRPDAQVHLLGTLDDGARVFGSLVSGSGLATINGVTTVVKMNGGKLLQIIGVFR